MATSRVGNPILHPAPSLMGGPPILQPRLVLCSQVPLERLSFVDIIPHVLTCPATLKRKMVTLADLVEPSQASPGPEHRGALLLAGQDSAWRKRLDRRRGSFLAALQCSRGLIGSPMQPCR